MVLICNSGGGFVLLQGMAYGGSLGTSLFTNVRFIIPAPLWLISVLGHLSISLRSHAVRLQRLDTASVLLRLCNSCGLSTITTVWPAFADHLRLFSRHRGSYHGECHRNNLGVPYLRYPAVAPSTGWDFRPRSSLPAASPQKIQCPEPSRRQQRQRRTRLSPRNIAMEDGLVSWLRLTFPLFSNDDIAKVLL